VLYLTTKKAFGRGLYTTLAEGLFLFFVFLSVENVLIGKRSSCNRNFYVLK